MYWTSKMYHTEILLFHGNGNLQNRNDSTYDRLYKKILVIDSLFGKFHDVYKPMRVICVDKTYSCGKASLFSTNTPL